MAINDVNNFSQKRNFINLINMLKN